MKNILKNLIKKNINSISEKKVIVYTNCVMKNGCITQTNKLYLAEVIEVGLNTSESMGYGFVNVLFNDGNILKFEFSDFGKTIFLTKRQAKNRCMY